jgi:hypothetical protein
MAWWVGVTDPNRSGQSDAVRRWLGVPLQDVSLDLTNRLAQTAAVIWRRHNGLETAAGPARDTFRRSLSPSARSRSLPAASNGQDLSTHSTRRTPPRSSRICPANDRETSRNDGNRWSTESAGRPQIRTSPQVAESATRTLSRWRHGFEPRWDYKRKAPGQDTIPESIGLLNRDSNAEYPANIPHRIERSECAKGRARRGWMHSHRTAHPALEAGVRSRQVRSQPTDHGVPLRLPSSDASSSSRTTTS